MSLLPDERYHAIVVDEGQDFARGLAPDAGPAAPCAGRGRPVGVPRPGPGALPGRCRGGVRAGPGATGAAGEPAQPGAGRRARRAASTRGRGRRSRCATRACGRASWRRRPGRTRSRRCARSCIGWSSRRASGPGTSASCRVARRPRARSGGSGASARSILGNAALADDGRHVGLPPEQIDDDPTDTVLFETIRRFKGLEAPVIVLVELPDEEHARGRLDALLYVALTRATTLADGHRDAGAGGEAAVTIGGTSRSAWGRAGMPVAPSAVPT